MNTHPWVSHSTPPFLFHPMGQNALDPNALQRFIPPVTSSTIQSNSDDINRATQTPQEVPQIHTPNRDATPQQVLDSVTFPRLSQISVDMMTNWPETLQHQHNHTPLTPAPVDLVNDRDDTDVASDVALQHIQMHLENELECANRAQKPSVAAQKRKRNARPMPETWKKNIRKTKRAKGEAYQSATGKDVSAKCIKDVDCSKCRLQCTENIVKEQREAIFDSYWGTASYVRQRDFLCSHVIEEEKARTTVKGEPSRKREWTRQYWLPKKSGKLLRVCKSFFLATMDVGCKTVDYALKKRKGGFFCDDDQRGKHEPTNKVPEEKLDGVRNHIQSFWHLNVSPSKKKKNGRLVLPADYNIRKMYQLYKDKCWEDGEQPQKEHVYRRIFNMEYNITFLEPKKDIFVKTVSEPDKILNAGISKQVSIMKPIEPRVESYNLSSTAKNNIRNVKEEGLNMHHNKERHRSKDHIKHQQLHTDPTAPLGLHHVTISSSAHIHQPQSFSLSNSRIQPDTAVNMSMSQFHMPSSFIHSHHAT